jgi:hypothetical protein
MDIITKGCDNLFEYDICLCASVECPRYEDCVRGGLTVRQGVYTMSYLKEVCNQNNNYEMFIGENKDNE